MNIKAWRIIIAFFKALLCAVLVIAAIWAFATYTVIVLLVLAGIVAICMFVGCWMYFYEEG
ncbi:hypothetical protein [Listeria newyorkensis]|uniref:Uncharacterized protein n=1 Tax=Listeria newyorkensis TaxID=1497681 RepID=A0A841Z193_9LIST|nr:hypothetical protein [Listeria newyorkensis]MBC1459358.1 hypothetical protein [Listeria newyorkensis]